MEADQSMRMKPISNANTSKMSEPKNNMKNLMHHEGLEKNALESAQL